MSFRTTTDVMHATAGKVDTVNDQVQAELNRLQGTVDSVQGVWRGEAQASFGNERSQPEGRIGSWRQQSSTHESRPTGQKTPTA